MKKGTALFCVQKLCRPGGIMTALVCAFMIALFFCPMDADAVEYTLNATSYGAGYPGVYQVTAQPGQIDGTIGIGSIAEQNLTGPTTEKPAIIMGAASPFEKKGRTH